MTRSTFLAPSLNPLQLVGPNYHRIIIVQVLSLHIFQVPAQIPQYCPVAT